MTDPALRFLEPLEPRTRGEAVLEALARMIDRAGLTVGDRLPPEVQLAQQLGVGRSTMREALNRWEGLGLIRRRRGDGTYLAARVPAPGDTVPVMVQLEGEALLRLLELRRCLETETARKAAVRASPAQRAEIGRLCDILLAIVARGEPYRAADHAFHGAISDATGNPMFGQTLRRLEEMFERSAESPFSLAAFGLASFPMHRDLADAIAAGDPDGAARAINAIIDSVETEIRGIIGAGHGNDAPAAPRARA
ncbi:MAG: FadR family transcriptional regulator [Rubellimicrobium sp.]|nr:FadR family transcriptional regulator [Rubellimicrobium sp.]